MTAFNLGGTTMWQALIFHGQLGTNADPSVFLSCSRIAPISEISHEHTFRKYIVLAVSELPLSPPPPSIDRSLFSVICHGSRCSASRRTNQSEPEFLGNSSESRDETVTISNGTRFAWLRARNGSSSAIDGGTGNGMRTLWGIADHRRLHGSLSGE